MARLYPVLLATAPAPSVAKNSALRARTIAPPLGTPTPPG